MTPQKFESLKENIIAQLRAHLLPVLYYHSADHTLDVIDAAERIATGEKINGTEMLILKTAALFHDTGYLFTAKNHEANSCLIAQSVLPKHAFSELEIDVICNLIMATKIPHNTKNKLEEILCDADLDYLGRADFYELSQNLYKEMRVFDKVKDEQKWNEIQVAFFEKHKYFTATSNALRATLKATHLITIKKELKIQH